MGKVGSSRNGCLYPVVARYMRALLDAPLEVRYAGRARYLGSAS